MAWKGFVYAALAAVSHSGIDASRKAGSKRMSSDQLVALVAILDAVLSNAYAYLTGCYKDLSFFQSRTFVVAVLMSSTVRLISGYMYQHALQLSPISVTVPYLAFTPAMLLLTGFLLVGEVPSMQGVMGVFVVTAGGYLLSRDDSGAKPKSMLSQKQPSNSHSLQSSKGLVASYTPGSFMSLYDLRLESGEAKEHPNGNKVRSWRYVEFLSSLFVGYDPGTVLMVMVAVLWSLTSGFDKLGLRNCQNSVAYLAVQRFLQAIPCTVYLLSKKGGIPKELKRNVPILICVSFSELATVYFYLKSLKFLLVSYAVAVKRSGILLSVIIGSIFFKESILKRLPYIVIMVSGMMLIVFAPDHTLLGHTQGGKQLLIGNNLPR